MANKKYDNLQVLMATGNLNWVSDLIHAYLVQNATYDASDKAMAEVGAQQVTYVPVQGKQVDNTGSLLGLPVSFNRVPQDKDFQVLITKVPGPGDDPLLLAFYDEDENGDPFNLQNNGTLIVRPQQVAEGETPQVGVWVGI